MRYNILQLLKNLRFHSHGKEITDADILEWANTKVSNSGSQSRMDSFRVPFESLLCGWTIWIETLVHFIKNKQIKSLVYTF